MPEKKCIHAREDIESVLRFADSIGLLLLPEYMEDNEVRTEKLKELQSFTRGTVLLFRPEWVKDGILLWLISGGPDAGKHFVRSSINFSPIKLTFSGDENVVGVRRLGICGVSFKRDWLHDKTNEMRMSPPEVETTYKQVCKHLLSKITVSAGGHRYHVCKQAAELAARMETRPPFDYIPWPPPNVKKTSHR